VEDWRNRQLNRKADASRHYDGARRRMTISPSECAENIASTDTVGKALSAMGECVGGRERAGTGADRELADLDVRLLLWPLDADDPWRWREGAGSGTRSIESRPSESTANRPKPNPPSLG